VGSTWAERPWTSWQCRRHCESTLAADLSVCQQL
jgi:hypothetical protein